jgi:hypothetical protein
MGHACDRRKRDQKKRGARSQREEAKLDVRRRVKGLLQRFKLLAEFEAIPPYVRDQFYDCCYPDPVLVFDESFPPATAFGGAYREIRDEVTFAFEHAGIVLTGFVLPVKDFISIAVPIEASVRRTLASINSPVPGAPRVPTVMRTFLEKAAGPLQHLVRQEVVDKMWADLHREIVSPMVSRSRLDGNLLHARMSSQQTFRGRRIVMTLYAEKAETKRVRLSGRGEPRWMYRVGSANVWEGIKWASWSRANVKGQWGDQLKMRASDEWPVYVQGHALERLRQRLDSFAYVEWAEHWMYESLRNPRIVERRAGGELMVAFEVQEQRLGYLVTTVRDGMVMVRTFLFLTMRETPEGRELAKRLKLTRDEMEYLRLHELSRFTSTDLKDDPELRRIFKQSGCGQLFKLAEDPGWMVPKSAPAKPFAAELKQYVGLAA